MATTEDHTDRVRLGIERVLLWLMLLLVVAVWFGLGSLIFLGILENVGR